MEFANPVVIAALQYLLPGFVAAEILYRLTAAARLTPFERVVEALVYVAVIQALVFPVRLALLWIGRVSGSFGYWTTEAQLAWSVVLAGLVGLALAAEANNDWAHKWLRRFRITMRTSYPSEWYGNLAENQGYIVLHLKDRRRLMGWPQEWPSKATEGHFVIAQAEWLTEGGATGPVSRVEKILIQAVEVKMIEFLRIVPLDGNGG